MSRHFSCLSSTSRAAAGLWLLLTLACAEQRAPGEPEPARVALSGARVALHAPRELASFDCLASPRDGKVVCSPEGAELPAGVLADVMPVQEGQLRLSWANPRFDGTTYTLDVSLRNLMREAIGTPDGVLADTNGIRVYVTGTSSALTGDDAISVDNPDGTATVDGVSLPYFRYAEILRRNASTSAKPWRFVVPSDLSAFGFRVLVSTEVQPMLVINEVLANPGGGISAADGGWLELYNAGTRDVPLTGLLLADSSTAGRGAYHAIADTVLVPAGGYVVIGNSRDHDANGGVAVDYAFGGALALGDGAGAIALARAYGVDTLAIDRVAFTDRAISASRGIARELRNPSLGNDDMDGTNWADAATTAVFGPAGRGTPGAQNSAFTKTDGRKGTPRQPVGVPVSRAPQGAP
jgi:hypothetical protein